MNSAKRASSFWAGAFFLMFVGMSLISISVQAQTAGKPPLKIVSEAQTREQLAQKVQLKLGETTLPIVMRALSEQTGLQIEAAGYLREHRLLMCMSDVSALTVLETLGELNDWKWQVVEPGHVLLGRPQSKTPLKVVDVSLALQAAMPKDFRRFLGANGSLKDAMYMPGANMSKSEMQALAKRNEEGKKLPPANPFKFENGGSLSTHTANLERGRRLLNTLKPQILDQKPLLCAHLTSEQQQALHTALTLSALEQILIHQHDLLTGVVRPHQRDPENIDVSVQNGNTLLIATYIDEMRDGKRHVQGSGTSYTVDAPATNNDRMLHFGGRYH